MSNTASTSMNEQSTSNIDQRIAEALLKFAPTLQQDVLQPTIQQIHQLDSQPIEGEELKQSIQYHLGTLGDMLHDMLTPSLNDPSKPKLKESLLYKQAKRKKQRVLKTLT